MISLIRLSAAHSTGRVYVNVDEIDYIEEMKKAGELDISTGKFARIEHARIHTKSNMTVDVTETVDQVLALLTG